ncbi:unnamed protein product [Rhizophagus irregularis]|nr:unnamed protein product [Rhizophagus irregularis]
MSRAVKIFFFHVFVSADLVEMRLKNATASGFIRHASLFSFLVQDFGDQTRELTWYGEMGFGLLLIRKGFEKSFRKSRTIPNSIIVVFLDFGAMGI